MDETRLLRKVNIMAEMKKDMVDDLDKMQESLELPKRVLISEMLDAEDVKVSDVEKKK